MKLTKCDIFWKDVQAMKHNHTNIILSLFSIPCPNVTDENILITFSPAEDQTCDPPHVKQTL